MNATLVKDFNTPLSALLHTPNTAPLATYFLTLVRRQGGAEAAREEELVQQTFSSTRE